MEEGKHGFSPPLVEHRGTNNRFFRLAKPFARENHALATTLFSDLVARLRFSRIVVATIFEPQGFEVERSEKKLAWASRKIYKKHHRRRVLTRGNVDKCSRLFFLALSSANKEDITDVSSACLIHHIAKSIVELLKVLFKKRETSEAAPKFSGKKTRHRASRSLSTPRFRISALHSERRKRAPMPLLPALFSKRVYDSKSVFGKEKEICVDEHHRNEGAKKIASMNTIEMRARKKRENRAREILFFF